MMQTVYDTICCVKGSWLLSCHNKMILFFFNATTTRHTTLRMLKLTGKLKGGRFVTFWTCFGTKRVWE